MKPTSKPPHKVATSPGERSIPVIDEKIDVRKIDLDQGGYRLTKRIETREEIVDELLRNHRVEIERVPMGTLLAIADMPKPRHEGDTFIVPVVEEVLVTEKRLRLVEEVRITRIEETHRQPRRVELRKEEVSIERLAAKPVQRRPR
jgi:stress response protein YsnF